MRKAAFCSALILTLSLLTLSQTKQTNTNTQARNTGRENDAGLVLESGTRLSGQLQSTLDARNANVGDRVVVKITQAVKQNGQILIPKGSSVIGRVTEVQ